PPRCYRLLLRTPTPPPLPYTTLFRSPDVMIARCKVLLRREIFDLPPHGTFVLHPGICPEYRNSHGCFWALSRRDLGRVGMSLLRDRKSTRLNSSHGSIAYAVFCLNQK